MRLFTNLIRHLFTPKQVWVVNVYETKNSFVVKSRVFLDYKTSERWRDMMEEDYFCQTLEVDVLWNERGD